MKKSTEHFIDARASHACIEGLPNRDDHKKKPLHSIETRFCIVDEYSKSNTFRLKFSHFRISRSRRVVVPDVKGLEHTIDN